MGAEQSEAEVIKAETAKVEIPQIVYQGEDKKLKERVRKFQTGSLRIAVFTLVGFVMGYYSYTYVMDNFFPTKLLMGIPYKLSEVIYVFLLGTDTTVGNGDWYLLGSITEFFPHSYLATWMAEVVTPVLLGGALYGSLAYFTGDKRVFTLRRFLKFAGVWCAGIVLFTGSVYGVNAKAVADNEALRGTPVFTLYDAGEDRQRINDSAVGAMLEEIFYRELRPAEIQRTYEDEVYLGIEFLPYRATICRVNYKDGYLAAEQGTTYHISEEFAEIVRDYAESHILPESGELSGAESNEEVEHE